MKNQEPSSNRLIKEFSPYLLQHAFNPVDWYPWGDEAFECAMRENKPVFLSIGYSSCHWCHVMAHESFEDPQVAQWLNRYFISVKVDREERPDVDELYMAFVHALLGRGGWPLSVFLTPDRRPFYGGTYYPKTSRHGMPGFMEVLMAVRQAWDNRKEEVLKSANDIVTFLGRPEEKLSTPLGLSACAEQAFYQLRNSFDQVYGGFGSAPKFPSPHQLMFLIRYADRTSEEQAWTMAEKTLLAMKAGGIFDHLGGGFHRYSTDRYWRLPHFEKMLTDQAWLALVYTEAWQYRKKDLWKQTAEATLNFVLRDLRSPEGGFYTALDADSSDGEGRYYLWSDQELKKALQPEEYEWVRKNWNIEAEGNIEEESTGRKNGLNILFETLTRDISDDEEDLLHKLDPIRKKLFHLRSQRPLPFRDDKILCDGNGLMIAALAKAGVIFRSEQYLGFASDAVSFSANAFLRPDGGLWRRYRNHQSGIKGVLDDYAMLIYGLIHFYQATARHDTLMLAIRLTETMIEEFWDRDQGAFFMSPMSVKDIIVCRKTLYDGAHPSGNSVAAWNLGMLGRITGNGDWIRMAQETAQVFSSDLNRMPYGFTFFLSAAELWLGPENYQIILTGNPESTEYRECIFHLHQDYNPRQFIICRDDRNPDDINRQIPSLQGYPPTQEPLHWYLCGPYACYAHGSSIEELQEKLKKNQ